MKVVHKNGIGVDCRLVNLTLAEVTSDAWSPARYDVDVEAGVYWRAVQQIVVNPAIEFSVGILLFVDIFSLFVRFAPVF